MNIFGLLKGEILRLKVNILHYNDFLNLVENFVSRFSLSRTVYLKLDLSILIDDVIIYILMITILI